MDRLRWRACGEKCRVTEPTAPDPTRHARHTGPITFTMAEIRRLIGIVIINSAHDTSHHLHWSAWRRHHQGHARNAHYRRRLQPTTT